MRYDPGNTAANGVLSADGLTCTVTPVGTGGQAMVTERKYSGKWYFELKLGNLVAGGSAIGVWEPVVSGAAGTHYRAMDAAHSLYSTGAGAYTTAPYGGSAWAANDVIGVAVDLDNSKIWFSRNGVYIAGDPAAGTTPAYGAGSSTGVGFSSTLGMGWHPVLSWANTDATSSTIQLLSKMQTYAPPSGFTAWGDSARTLAPANKSTSATLSGGNRTIADAASTHLTGAYCDEGITNRKIYFEAKFDSPGAAGRTAVGVAVQHNLAENTIADFKAFNGTAGSGADQICVTDEGKVYERNVLKYTGTAYSSGDTCMFAFDSSSGKVWVGKNGTWFNGGDPAAGTGMVHTATGTSNKTYHAAAKANNSAGAWQVTVNFGSTKWTYEPPLGFSMMGYHYGTLDASVPIATTMARAATFYRTLAASTAITTAFAGSRKFSVTFATSAAAATAFTPRKVLYAVLGAAVAAATTMAAKTTFRLSFGSSADVSAVIDLSEIPYIGYVANRENGAHSTYDGFDFNSMAAFDQVYYGARSDGLYVLDGATDVAGTPIDARIRTGRDILGVDQQKRVAAVYVGIKASGTMQAKVVTDSGGVNVYNMVVANPQRSLGRAKVGRGYRSDTFQFELANTSGIDFDADVIEVYPVVLQRRVP